MSDEDEEAGDSRYKYASGYRGVEAAPGMEDASGTHATGGRLLEDREDVELSNGVGVGAARSEQPHLFTDSCEYGFCIRQTAPGSEYCEEHQRNSLTLPDPGAGSGRGTVIREKPGPDTRERLTRIEAKLDALLAVLDVDLEEVESDA